MTQAHASPSASQHARASSACTGRTMAGPAPLPPTSKQLTASQELVFCAGVRMHLLEAAQCEHLVALVAMAGTCMADTVTPPLWAPSYASLQSRIIQLLACLCRSAQGDRPADARMLALMPADADSGSVRCLFATGPSRSCRVIASSGLDNVPCWM